MKRKGFAKMTTIKQIIEEAVKEALDPVGKTETGKKVGVGQIRDIDNDGDIDSSDAYLAYRRKKITQAMKKEDRELNEKTMTWGDLPSEDVFEDLMDGKAFNMKLQGADSLAFEYAMTLSDNPGAGSTASAGSLRATIEALINAPEPDELSDDQYEEVENVLDEWNDRYGDVSIEETAWSLASGIMEVLGIEWI